MSDSDWTVFEFEALDPQGNRISDIIVAKSEAEARRSIEGAGYNITKISVSQRKEENNRLIEQFKAQIKAENVVMLDRIGREDLSCGIEPRELGLFYNELMHIYAPLVAEFPNWKLSMLSSGTLESPIISTAQLCCQHNKVPYRDRNRPASIKYLWLTISIGGTDSALPYFERADVQWDRPKDLPTEFRGLADLLNGEKPSVTRENVTRFLDELPTLYSELRRIMTLLT